VRFFYARAKGTAPHGIAQLPDLESSVALLRVFLGDLDA
jgi:hypothetical protein